MINEAIYALFEGSAPWRTSSVMKLGMNQPHGSTHPRRPYDSTVLISIAMMLLSIDPAHLGRS